MSVELYEDDVWWKGMVLRKSPAGVFVYLPGKGLQVHLLCSCKLGCAGTSQTWRSLYGGRSAQLLRVQHVL